MSCESTQAQKSNLRKFDRRKLAHAAPEIAVPILNGVASLSSEAALLNSTAAKINSLVRDGNPVVAQVQRKSVGLSAQE